ncbi:MAG: bifunctional (p)ppGpp synthetase/guanosine-3',5'-bis(diphosphate) 3'-pyrophosphohydrolase [Desulfobacteraceae bacterium]|nr:bifunctional (p)ppGpp synthetase/guanosine-3',5'-bis(diphosphate) 3'-pyrophosphohydrolase [Desulfobacteraceae bacterium]
MKLWSQDLYLKAWNFASNAHKGQKLPGSDIPYINHIGSVAMEVMSAIVQSGSVGNPDLAVQCALLHDTVEDTETTYEQIKTEFGKAVADGVKALSKDSNISGKSEQMRDSLSRIKKQPEEIWMVKLADRITNLQKPPYYWTKNKTEQYCDEAVEIHRVLASANDFLSSRLLSKIDVYKEFIK